MRTFLLFFYTCLLALTLPVLFPDLRLLYFAPFLILCFYRVPLPICLRWALGCGLIIDLFSSQTRFGTYALNYCLVTACLYKYKYQFFEDRLSTLPVMTFFFACLAGIVQMLLYFAMGKPFVLSLAWAKSDLFLMPLWDSLYAIIAFVLPLVLWQQWRRNSFKFFLRRGRER